ncbi:MAG TPA: hypothetical protein VG820_05445, partial [Fimbriimonadaceae bacterium]|nr:hypothetical protein [Fimbriimonadaceae bacterium]
VSPGLALACSELLRTGAWSRLRWLQNSGESPSEIAKAPGIGHKLTDRISESVGAVSLEQLYLLAGGERLGFVEGFGRHRLPSLSRFLERALGVDHLKADPHPMPNGRLLARLEADFRARIASGRIEAFPQPDGLTPAGFISHRVVGPWHCSLKLSGDDPESVAIAIDQGDFLFDIYRIRVSHPPGVPTPQELARPGYVV